MSCDRVLMNSSQLRTIGEIASGKDDLGRLIELRD